MTKVPEDLLKAAKEVIKNAYAPYSGYRVASAVRASSGRIYRGVNVENASYGLTVCAERVAVFSAVAEGERSIREVLVLTEKGDPAPPCGACLQVISEFGDDDTVIYSVSLEGGERTWRLKDLLPTRFGPSFLGRAQK
ncbi:MAG: cytidine deaminase [Acidilobus sp.]